MPVAQKNRDRLRSALLGPLGQEATDMLMKEVDQSALRDHVDERFAEQDRRIDERFAEQDRRFDKRFDKIEKRLDMLTDAIIQLHETVSASSRPANALVYTVCATFALVSLTALATAMLQAFAG